MCDSWGGPYMRFGLDGHDGYWPGPDMSLLGGPVYIRFGLDVHARWSLLEEPLYQAPGSSPIRGGTAAENT